jgi:hypothetical protein
MGLAFVAATLLVVVLVLSAVFVIYRVLRKIYRLLARNWPVFGGTPQARLAGLGIAVAIFPQMVWGPIETLRWISQTVLSGLQTVWAPFTSVSGSGSSGFSAQAVNQAFIALAGLLGQALTAVNFPYTQFILGFACWSIAGQVLTGPGQQGIDWSNFVGRISSAGWKNVVLFVILFLGCYLSISSITAIPSLQKTENPVEADKARLADQLKLSRSPKDEPFFQEPADVRPFQRLTLLLSIADGRPPADAAGTEDQLKGGHSHVVETVTAVNSGSKEPPVGAVLFPKEPLATPDTALISDAASTSEAFHRQIEQIREWIKREDVLRKYMRDQLKSLQKTVAQQEDKLQTTVVGFFDSGTVGHMGARDRSRYIRTLDSDFEHRTTQMERPLRECAFAIRNLEDYWQSMAEEVERAVKGDAQMLTAAINKKKTGISLETTSILRSYPNMNNGMEYACHATPSADYIAPPPPGAGADWGIFRFFAGWLLTSESLDLAVIAGMLGAGLLGSSASSFIRQQGKRVQGDPLVSDLAGVVIRGFSAAIVIFLAVEGGLNIFGSSSGQPNPYVLLCTCLVGAVFSEDVWSKTHKWLEGEKDKQTNNDKEKKESIGTETTPANK